MNAKKELEALQKLKNSHWLTEFLEEGIDILLQEEKKEIIRKIDITYGIASVKHSGQSRQTGEPYFVHLQSVAEIILNEFDDPTIDEVLIGLLHDIIEDTAVTYTQLQQLFGNTIADAVYSISKKPWQEYMTTAEKADFMEMSDADKATYMLEKKDELKTRRNADYFGHINDLSESALKVKLADRLHNIRTLWICSEEKKKRKIEETEMYMLPVAHKKFPKIALMLEEEIKKIQEGKIV